MSLIKQLLLVITALSLVALFFLFQMEPTAPAFQSPTISQAAGQPVEEPGMTESTITETTEPATTEQPAPETHEISVVGLWSGALDAGGVTLRLILKVIETERGVWQATLESIDQGALDLPIDELTLTDSVLRFVMSALAASYEGSLSSDGTQITGTWRQGGGELPLNFVAIAEAPSLTRPQDPVEPYPYLVEEIKFMNENASIELAGTLTKPSEGEPFAAVVLVTGSGPQNRDEELLNHRPFLVLADHLTRNGIAVLRYDERGVGESGGDFSTATTEDFAADADAAVRYLQTRTEINPKKIGVVGHSEGGLVAPLVASQNPEVAFIVMLAGPGISGEEIIYLQSALIARAEGASEEMVAKNYELTKQLFEIIKNEPDNDLAAQQMLPLMNDFAAALTDEERAATGFTEAGIEQQIAQVTSPWFRFFLVYDPAPTLASLKCPVLALNGELDLQVPARENLLAISAALEAGGNRDYAVIKLPSLNHLFQMSKTGAPSEYSAIEETFASVALKTISDWIISQTQMNN